MATEDIFVYFFERGALRFAANCYIAPLQVILFTYSHTYWADNRHSCLFLFSFGVLLHMSMDGHRYFSVTCLSVFSGVWRLQ